METLAERIARDGPVSELDAIGWAIRLAKRLEALHALGVAHGSVSPACVIAAGQDRNARAYLADVQHTSPMPAYQSPERILGGDISTSDDVWALAATLYALLTGQSPFAAGSDPEIRQRILAAAPPPLAVYDVGDDDLQHILDHAFAREMGRRTASITALRRALEEWHPDRGVANLPPLEDEDSTNDDDEGARTMLVRDSGGYLQSALGLATGPTAGQPAAPARVGPPAQPVARAPQPQVGGQPQGFPGGQPQPPAFAGGQPQPHAFGGGGYPQHPGMPAMAPQPAPAAPGPVPKVNQPDDDDDDDDNVRTMMRSLPKDDLAAIIANASARAPQPAAGAPPAPAPFPGSPAQAQAPGLGPPGAFPRPGPPRPVNAVNAGGTPPAPFAAGPAPATPDRTPGPPFAMGEAPKAPLPAPHAAPHLAAAVPSGAQAFGGRPPPTAPIDDEDSEDEDIRTVMRTPEQMIQEEESHDAPRTMLLRDDDPWAPGRQLPAAGNPAAAPPPAAGNPAGRAPWADGPGPAPTMALPISFEPSAPDFAHAAPTPAAGNPAGPPEPYLQGLGTQKIPPPGMLGASGANLGASFPGAPAGQQALNLSVGGVPQHQQVLAGLQPVSATGPRVLGSAPPSDQGLVPFPQGSPASKKGLFLAALIALVIAAGATFAFLKLKGL